MVDLPIYYFLSAGLATVLAIFGFVNLRKSWGLPYLAVVFTISVWYLTEPFYSPGEFLYFNSEHVEKAYEAVFISLLTFSAFAPVMTNLLRPKQGSRVQIAQFSPEDAFPYVVMLWLLLLAYGTFRLQGDLFAALFPIGARSGAGMWSRPAGAGGGSDAFIVSTASYLYTLCLAAFGILLTLMRRNLYTVLALVLIAISWPFAFLQGSRNIVLAIALPTLLSFLFFSKQSLAIKALVTVSAFAALELLFRVIINYRNIGFANLNITDVVGIREAKSSQPHLGLNMASELVYCIQYISDRTIEVAYGGRYITELVNFIPRAIWPNKPEIGIDDAMARGYGGATNDTGLVSTISTGMIGGGVLNFGLLFGPIMVGLLMGIWVGVLSRFRSQGTALRLILFLVGAGLTFNLGRDISLLVLWPLVFGYIAVRLLEAKKPNRTTPPKIT